jgi:predicted TIM-barrel fold metal-dependent hydrolase
VVDAHVHVLPERVARDRDAVAAADPWFAACHDGARVLATETDLLAHLDTGIDRAVVLPWPFRDPELCREATDFVAALQRRHPQQVIGFGIVQPLDPGAEAELERIAGLGLRGIGELNADAQGFQLEDARLRHLAELSAARDLTWTLHCSEPVGHGYPGKGTATPDRLGGLVERCPDLRLIAAHLGGGLPLYGHMPEVRDLCRSIFFDTAALPFLYAPSVIAAAAALIGADRLLLGTDFPLLGLDRCLRQLDAAGIAPDQRAAVIGGNATTLFDR